MIYRRKQNPIMERIAAKSIDDAGCTVWTGAKTQGNPVIRKLVDEKWKTVLVRREMWEHQNGPIPIGMVIRCTCETDGCISCLELTTPAKLNKQLGAMGRMSGPVRSAAIARAKRAVTKVTQEDVAVIRASDEPGRVLAKRYGIAQGTVSKIKLYKTRLDLSSPFGGLGAR